MEYDDDEECDFLEIEQNKPFNIHNREENEIDFYAEINSTMHVFGDVTVPLRSSVELMHKILQGQMALLIRNAEDVMKLRKRKRISHEDILFLMRKNKVLLKRLFHFLYVEDMRTCFSNASKKLGKFSPEKTKKVSQCLEYLAVIEKFAGDLTSVLKDKDIIDHVHLKRLKRRDLMTSAMTREEYEYFSEFTLKETFCCKNTNEKFKNWLQQCSSTEFQITPLALSIIHFLARETIAGIVDKALEIKSRKFQFENNSDLDGSENDFEISEPEKNFEMNESVNNFHPSSSEISRSFDRNKNSDIKGNINLPNGFQEMNLFSNVSHYTNNIVKCPVATNTRKNMMCENSAIDSAINDMQEENTASNSSHLDQNTFSKNYASGKSDSNKKLNDNVKKGERNYDMCDSFESDDDRFSSTYYVIDETSSTMNYESGFNQGSDDIQFRVLDASKKISKTPNFSLNFQEKPFSICCEGSETAEIYTSSSSESGSDNEDTEDKDLATMECLEESEEFTPGFVPKSSSQDFDKCSRNFSFITPKKTDSEIHWFPKDAITPSEIHAAFIEYQRPLPVSVLLKSKFPHLPLRKPNLVCLANPNEI